MIQENAPVRSIPELLAPAGSWDCLVSAIAAGADAVYLGGEQFGARHLAPNFDRISLPEAVTYAHLHDVRVYVTVNTLIYEDELKNVFEYLVFLYQTGVDAILIQDAGLLLAAQRLVPRLPVHASTQMTLHSVSGARWAVLMGCSRIVLARELSKNEIKTIADAITDLHVGLEIFIHGALCYGWSGQCLLSSVIGGRSGNRGMCAQPCRKPYQLMTGLSDRYGRFESLLPVKTEGRYLLSTKDLCSYTVMDTICSLPVISLKIEGRMRSPRYVATVVSIYRKAIDAVLQDKFCPDKDDLDALSLSYSRGFTTGYLLLNDPSAVMGRDRPGDRGLYIGKVCRCVDKKGAYIRSTGEHLLRAGDGLVCIHEDDEQGLVLRSDPEYIQGQFFLPFQNLCYAGDPVYLTSRRSVTTTADAYGKNPEIQKRQMPLDLLVKIRENGTINVEGTITSHISPPCSFIFDPDITLVRAEKKPLSKDVIQEHLVKTGNTPFYVCSLILQYNGGLFAPIRLLNQIRRDIIKKAEETLIASCIPEKPDILRAEQCLNLMKDTESGKSGQKGISPVKGSSIIVLTDRVDSCRAAIETRVNTVVFEFPNRYTQDENLSFFTEWKNLSNQSETVLFVKLPRILRENQVQNFLRLLPLLVGVGVDGVMVDGHGLADVIASQAPTIDRIGYIGLNICNHLAVEAVKECFSMVTVSPELNLDQVLSLASGVKNLELSCSLGILVQGNIEALISQDLLTSCINEKDSLSYLDNENSMIGIRDEKNRTFVVSVDPIHRTRVFNAVETTLIDFLPQLYQNGISSYIIDARGRPPLYVSDMIRIYQEAIHYISDEIEFRKRLTGFKKEIKKRVRGGMTAGAFGREQYI